MSSSSELVPFLVALLLGGLVPTIGLTIWSRSPGGAARLGGLGPGAFAGVNLAALALGALGGTLLVKSVLAAADTSSSLPGPIPLFILGIAIGAPLALPTLFTARSAARAREEKVKKRALKPATREERRAYAAELAEQIRELSVPPREVVVRAGGDGDRVLFLEGGINSKEGNRLAAALREDLKDLGFKRVEGTGPGKGWWAKV